MARFFVVLVMLALSAGSVVAQTKPMPPGHPPTDGAVVPPPRPGSGTGGTALTWTVPPAWKSEPPTSAMRRAQYRIPGPGGPAECIVFYFGPGQGGSPQANVERWASQFRRPDGSAVGDTLKTRAIKVGDVPVTLVEVTGTFVGGMGSGPSGAEHRDHMMLAAIAEGPDANWFFRAIGPRATLAAARADFEKMTRSIKRGQ